MSADTSFGNGNDKNQLEIVKGRLILADDFGGFQIAIAEVFEVGHVYIYI